LTMHG